MSGLRDIHKAFQSSHDPYLRAVSLSTHVHNWDFITKGHLDQVLAYGMHNFPISRAPAEVIQKLKEGFCQSSMQLSILVCNLGNLCRPMDFAGKKVHACNTKTRNKKGKRLFGLKYAV